MSELYEIRTHGWAVAVLPQAEDWMTYAVDDHPIPYSDDGSTRIFKPNYFKHDRDGIVHEAVRTIRLAPHILGNFSWCTSYTLLSEHQNATGVWYTASVGLTNPDGFHMPSGIIVDRAILGAGEYVTAHIEILEKWVWRLDEYKILSYNPRWISDLLGKRMDKLIQFLKEQEARKKEGKTISEGFPIPIPGEKYNWITWNDYQVNTYPRCVACVKKVGALKAKQAVHYGKKSTQYQYCDEHKFD